jgi:hypothetical protein
VLPHAIWETTNNTDFVSRKHTCQKKKTLEPNATTLGRISPGYQSEMRESFGRTQAIIKREKEATFPLLKNNPKRRRLAPIPRNILIFREKDQKNFD